MAATATTPPPAFTLVVGSEALLAERAVDRVLVQARAVDPETERRVIDASADGAALAVAEACSPSLFGGGAVVVVEKAEGAGDPCVAALRSAICDPTDGVALVVLHAGGAKGRKNLDALAKLSPERVAAEPVKGARGCEAFVQSEMRTHGKRLSGEAQDLLLLAVGLDVRALAAACAQLAADVPGTQIGADEVRMYFEGAAEIKSYQISDQVMARRPAAALRLLRLSEGPGDSAIGPALTAMLAASIRQAALFTGTAPGLSDRDLAVRLKVSPYRVKSVRQQANQWTTQDLARAVMRIARLDAAVKGGLRPGEYLDPTQKGLAIEQAVGELAERNRESRG